MNGAPGRRRVSQRKVMERLMTDTPVILSTLGDAGGVGPELVARTLDHPEITRGCKRVIAGHPRIFDMGREVAGVATDLPRFTDIEAAIASPALPAKKAMAVRTPAPKPTQPLPRLRSSRRMSSSRRTSTLLHARHSWTR